MNAFGENIWVPAILQELTHIACKSRSAEAEVILAACGNGLSQPTTHSPICWKVRTGACPESSCEQEGAGGAKVLGRFLQQSA